MHFLKEIMYFKKQLILKHTCDSLPTEGCHSLSLCKHGDYINKVQCYALKNKILTTLGSEFIFLLKFVLCHISLISDAVQHMSQNLYILDVLQVNEL